MIVVYCIHLEVWILHYLFLLPPRWAIKNEICWMTSFSYYLSLDNESGHHSVRFADAKPAKEFGYICSAHVYDFLYFLHTYSHNPSSALLCIFYVVFFLYHQLRRACIQPFKRTYVIINNLCPNVVIIYNNL